MPHNWVTCITLDNSGNKWIGFPNTIFGEGGLVKFDDTNLDRL